MTVDRSGRPPIEYSEVRSAYNTIRAIGAVLIGLIGLVGLAQGKPGSPYVMGAGLIVVIDAFFGRTKGDTALRHIGLDIAVVAAITIIRGHSTAPRPSTAPPPAAGATGSSTAPPPSAGAVALPGPVALPMPSPAPPAAASGSSTALPAYPAPAAGAAGMSVPVYPAVPPPSAPSAPADKSSSAETGVRDQPENP